MFKFKFCIIILILFICSCSSTIEQGKVINKYYEPERTWIQFMPMFISDGKSSHTILIPMYMRDDEDFILSIAGLNADGEMDTACYYIMPDQYKEINVGDEILTCELKGDCNDPDERKRVNTND